MEIHTQVRGTFDGQYMIGEDEAIYLVPLNYACKSRLVEGDKLKLTIYKNGETEYKQIEPIQREKFIGKVVARNGLLRLEHPDGRLFKILPVAVSYYRLAAGQEVIGLTSAGASWAAIDSTIKMERIKKMKLEIKNLSS